LTDVLYRKTAVRLLLPIAIITFINALDRMNISFAASPMMRDADLSPTSFGTGVSAFFLAYLLFQYPHALLLRRIGIRFWLLLSMTLWGIAGVLMSRVQDAQDFYHARFLLGAAEAGFAPGMTWYISRWTLPATRARAMAFALSAVPVALVLGGPLCGWLLGLANPMGIAEWRFMFLVSAIPNFVFAVVAAFWFVDRPSKARWLTVEEAARLEAQGTDANERTPPRIALAAALQDRRIWLCALAWFLVMTGAYALVFWLPQIVRQLHLADREFLIGTLSALPQAGLLAGLILNARHSDRSGERLAHTAVGAGLAGLALIAALLLPAGTGVLALLVVAGFGLGAAQGVFWTVPPALGIGGGQVPVGVVTGINMAGTAGGIFGPWMLGWLLERSGNHAPGIGLLAGCLLFAAVILLWGRRWRLTTPGADHG
jgi:MFS transporter, ACS family, tartrate transporter